MNNNVTTLDQDLTVAAAGHKLSRGEARTRKAKDAMVYPGG